MKKIISILICIIMSCSSCNGKTTQEQLSVDKEPMDAYNNITDAGPKNGGELNLFSTYPDTFNPIITKNAYIKDALSHVYESLIKIDNNQKPIPCLSTDWKVSNDGKIWSFKLRNDVIWHDGIYMTAHDVVFTLKKILNTNTNSLYISRFKNIVSFSAVKDDLFKVILKEPDSYTPWLMSFPVIANHYYLNEDFLNTTRNFTPMGTGPYRFSQYIEKESVSFKANEKYWDKNIEQGKGYYVGRIKVNFFESVKSINDVFKSGKVDMIMLEKGTWERYIGRKDIKLKKYPTNQFEFVSFNVNESWLGEKAVRQAIGYAIDKVDIINSIIPGEAIPSDLPVLPDTWLNDTDIVSINGNIEKANEILDNSGWVVASDGWRFKKINKRNYFIIIDLMVNTDNEVRLSVANMIKEQLKSIGIQVNIDSVDWDSYIKRLNKKDYKMALAGYRLTSVPDISFMYSSTETNNFNIANFKNEQVDEVLKNISLENDLVKKKTLHYNLKTILNDEMPYIGLYFYNDAVLYNKKIRGNLSPFVWDKFNDISSWYILTN